MVGPRLASLDITRGIIVAIMALDHARIFFSAAQFDPVDLAQTTPGWFFTRLITHLCAPGFFFIAGLGIAMAEAGGGSKLALARFVALRGLWLIVLELTIMGVAWSFGLNGWLWFGVLWGLGASMIVLAGLVFAPRTLLAIAALALTVLSDQWLGLMSGNPQSVLTLLATGGVWDAPILGPKIVLYPLVPWLCLMVLGYCAAPLLLRGGQPRPGRIAALGGALIALFVAARASGFGGGVSEQGGLLGFLNVEKYPPSLQFSLLTLGALLLVFSAVAALTRDDRAPAVLHPVRIYGRVPFFFYVLHVYLIHAGAFVCAVLLGWPTAHLFWSGVGPNLIPPDGYGFDLLGVYAAWLVALAVLYPLCLWFAGVKEKRRDWWLRYL